MATPRLHYRPPPPPNYETRGQRWDREKAEREQKEAAERYKREQAGLPPIVVAGKRYA